MILKHPSVHNVCVIPIPDPAAGEVPLAWVIKKQGMAVTQQEIITMVQGEIL